MGWEHQIAKEFKKRDNPQNYAYFTGDVLSPVPKRLPDGTIIYEGPTIISCFEGAIMLAVRPAAADPQGRRHPPTARGRRWPCWGTLFDRQAGGQQILIAGVAQHVV